MDSTRLPDAIEGLLPAVLETVSTPVVVLDREATIQLFNRSAERVSGYERDEVLGRPVWFLLHPDDLPQAQTLLEGLFSGTREHLAGAEVSWVTRNHERRPMAWTTATLQGEMEGQEWIVCTGLDLTELHQLQDRTRDLLAEDALRQAREDALRSSEAKFSGIVEMASDAIVSVDSRQRIALFNRGAERIFGWAAPEVMGRPLEILLPLTARESHGDHIHGFGRSTARARPMGERREISGLRKDGEVFPAEASIIQTDVDGERFYTVVLRDISERHRAERQQRFLVRVSNVLAESLEWDQTLATLAEIVVSELAEYCIIDLLEEVGEVRRIRVSAREGVDPASAQTLEEIDLDRTRNHLAYRALVHGDAHLVTPVTPEVLDSLAQSPRHREALGGLGAVSFMAVPLEIGGKVLGALCLIASSERRPYDEADLEVAREVGLRAGMAVENARLYENAQRAIRARDDILGVVSHDLGNPLQAVFIGLEALERARSRREGGSAGAPVGDDYYLSAIRRSAELMQRLIHELLEVRRMEEGHLAMNPMLRPLSPLIDEALQLIDPLARVKAVTLKQEVDGDSDLHVLADGDRVLQVLSNLVGNAVKHTPGGGTVKVEAWESDDEICLAVRDNGPGIPKDHLDQVFDRFWRAEKTGGKGIGLGLAIARGIVRAHGGRVWAESELGEGSTFHVRLPRPDDSAANPEPNGA